MSKAQVGFYIVLAICFATLAGTGYVVTKQNMDLATAQMEQQLKAGQTLGDLDLSKNTDEPDPEPEPEPDPEPEVNRPVQAVVKPVEVEEPDHEPEAQQPKNTLYVWPVKGDVTREFSGAELVFSQTMEDWRAHEGIDIKGTVGTPVKAMSDGVVTDCYYDELKGYVIIVTHPDGLISFYANLSPAFAVEKGEEVKAGQTIGGIGESAIFEGAEEPHLHLEVLRDGAQLDPREYVK